MGSFVTFYSMYDSYYLKSRLIHFILFFSVFTMAYTCEQCDASFPKLNQLLQHRRAMNHWKHRCESCCLKFRELFMGLTKKDGHGGIDPFEKCVTIASACNLVYRTNFLEHESIAIIPSQGYRPEEKQSIMAYKWLSYLAQEKQINIQHGRNMGEKHIGPYKVDGYYEQGDNKIVLEFHGCFWHGCPKCFSKTTLNPVNDKNMGELYARTMEKKQFIEQNGYSYVSIWECDFKRDMEKDEDMKEYVDSLEIVSPLEPRDAFFGGRTEAFKLYEEASENKKIKYYDVTSLYPWVNKTGKIPLGHPEIITENFKDITCYEGLIKCKVLPPQGLHIPVLPAKCNGKLYAEHVQKTTSKVRVYTVTQRGHLLVPGSPMK